MGVIKRLNWRPNKKFVINQNNKQKFNIRICWGPVVLSVFYN